VTQENKKKNIAQELERAEDCLKSADLLFSHGQITDAISRLYYYAYHSVRALLLSGGFEPKTHAGSLRLLGMHFIKPGILEPEMSHIFTKLMKYREEADYNPSYIFTEEDYVSFKNEASGLHDKIRQFLKSEKLISNDI
jgi:uncharacterized protein (UPF0332 family)